MIYLLLLTNKLLSQIVIMVRFHANEDEGVVPDYEDDESLEEEIRFDDDDDEGGDDESVASASTLQGADVGSIPERSIYGDSECRFLFDQSSDKGEFRRVCGCSFDSCARVGHRVGREAPGGQAQVGTYRNVKSRKYIDGKFNTFVRMEDFLSQSKEEQRERRAGVEAAASNLGGAPLFSSGKEDSGPMSEDDEKPSRATKSRVKAPPLKTSSLHVPPGSKPGSSRSVPPVAFPAGDAKPRSQGTDLDELISKLAGNSKRVSSDSSLLRHKGTNLWLLPFIRLQPSRRRPLTTSLPRLSLLPSAATGTLSSTAETASTQFSQIGWEGLRNMSPEFSELP